MLITKFDKWIKFNESKKEDRLNFILDKMSSGNELSQVERNFLDNFSSIEESDLMDSTLLDSSNVYDKVTTLLGRTKIVFYSKNKIDDIKYCEEGICLFSDNNKIVLPENCLFNIIHNVDNDYYTLEIHDEYHEKMPLNND